MGKNRNGFTLIEVLGVIVILGVLATVGIVSVSKLLQKARVNHYVTQEKNMVMAAQSYYNVERKKLPRNIGQSVTITLGQLIDAGVIGEVLDYSKGQCSHDVNYVKVTKYASNKYSYYASLTDCPARKIDPDEEMIKIKPTIGITNPDVEKKVTITIKGDSNETVGLLSYSYVVYKKTDNKYVEIINTGDKLIKGKTKVIEKVALKKHSYGDYKFVVKAVNINGFELKKTREFKILEEQLECGNFEVETITNKTETTTVQEDSTLAWTNGIRKIKIKCDNCDEKDNVITIDNAYLSAHDDDNDGVLEKTEVQISKEGKSIACTVPVYIDKTPPKITLNVYACADENHDSTTGSSLKKIVTSSATPVTIESESINPDDNGWFNKVKAPYGLCYKFKIEDNGGLNEEEWSWNKSGLKVGDSGVDTLPVSTSNGRTSSTASLFKKKSKTIIHSLSAEGARRAKLVISDNAGNKTTINIKSNLDRTAPNKPSVAGYKKVDSETLDCSSSVDGLAAYTSGSWYNGYVYTKASGSTDAISGGVKYYLTTAGHGSSDLKNQQQSCRNTAKESTASTSITNTYKACDAAGNCSSGTAFTVKLDRTYPSVTFGVYACADSNHNSTTGSVLKSVTATNTPVNITSSSITNNVNGWFNKTNARYGLCYQVSASDSAGLSQKTWSHNAAGLKTDASNLNNFNSSSDTNLSGTSQSFMQYLSSEGARRAQLVVRDVAGNEAVINLETNMDRTAPGAPTVAGYKKANSSNLNCSASVSGLTTYTSNSWYKGYVYTKASGSTDTMSGGVKYYLTTTGQGSDNITNSNQSCRNTSTEATSSSSVKNTYKACDDAGNCSSGTEFTIKLDRTAPSVPTTHFYKWANNNTLPSSTSGLSSYTPGNWSKMKIYTKPGGSTDAGAGGVYYQYTTTGATANATNETGEYRTIQAEGSSTIKYRACDSLSNCSNYNTAQTVMVDTTKPTVTIDYSTTGANAFKYTGSATDATSGVSKYYKFTKDKSNPSSLSFSNTDNSAISSPGSYITANKYYAYNENYTGSSTTAYTQNSSTADTYYLCVKDNAGNIGCSGGKNDYVMCKTASNKVSVDVDDERYPLVYLWTSIASASNSTCKQDNSVKIDSDTGSQVTITKTGPYITVNIGVYRCQCTYDKVGFSENQSASVCAAEKTTARAVHSKGYAYIVYNNSDNGEASCKHAYSASNPYVSTNYVKQVCSNAIGTEPAFHGWIWSNSASSGKWNEDRATYAKLPVGNCTSNCTSNSAFTGTYSKRQRAWLHNGSEKYVTKTNANAACQLACQKKTGFALP